MLLRAVLAAGLLAIGCGADRVDLPASIAVGDGFTAEQTEAIFSAADAWTQATKGAAKFQFFVGNGANIDFATANLDPHTTGETHVSDAESATIRIDLNAVQFEIDDLEERHPALPVMKDTAMHELGHAFGLPHLQSGLMKAKGYSGACVDQLALDAFCGNYNCPTGAAPTCPLSK